MSQHTDDEKVRHAVLAERIFDGRDWRSGAALLFENGRVLGLPAWADVPHDCAQQRLPSGTFLAPGLIDLQINGGGGVLFNDQPTAEGMRTIARAHRQFGTTALLPTMITDRREQMQKAIAAVSGVVGTDGILGVHLEGPFISPARPGVHRKDHITRAEMRDLEWLHDLAGAGHSMITLAPEHVPDHFVRALVASGIRVSVGHSEASAEIVMQAVADGMTGVTHLFNAMPPLMSRAPGIVGAALAERRLIAGLIVDGIHVDAVAIRAAFAAKGADGIALVSDAMPTVGSSLSRFQLMGKTISLTNGKLTSQDGTLAGAHLELASAIRNAVTLAGIPLDHALRAASETPARFLGIDHERGVLSPGARADFVAFSNDLTVRAVWVDGRHLLNQLG